MEAKADNPTSTDRLRTQTAAVGEDLRELGRITKDVAYEKLGDARQEVRDLESALIQYVRHNPVKSVLIAGGTGLVLGMLLGRR